MTAAEQMERSLDRWRERERNAKSDEDRQQAEREVRRLLSQLGRES